MNRIKFFDRSDQNGDAIEFSQWKNGDADVTLLVSILRPRLSTQVVQLNYSQVFKLRDKLNTFLSEHLGSGAPLWEEKE